MARKYTMRSGEEKMEIVKQVLAGAPEQKWESQVINRRQVHNWTKKVFGGRRSRARDQEETRQSFAQICAPEGVNLRRTAAISD